MATDYISVSTSIFNNASFSKICTIYPNPSTGIVNIEAVGLNSIEVYNSIGQVVYSLQPESDKLTIDLSHLGTGAYMINVVTEKGTARTGLTLE